MDELLEGFKEAIIARDADKANELTRNMLDKGVSPEKIVYEAASPAMEIVGQLYENGQIFLPEMLMSAVILSNSIEIVKPMLNKISLQGMGKVVMGTVQGDIHTIGLGIVCMMLEGSGFTVFNLGIDVSAENFVEKIKQEKADILGMSALLSTTAPRFADVIAAIEEAGLRTSIKVMIGGVAANQKLADTIRADGYGASATDAVRLAKSFMKTSA